MRIFNVYLGGKCSSRPLFFTFYLSPKNSFSFLSSRSAGCDSKSFKYWRGFRFEYWGGQQQSRGWQSHIAPARSGTNLLKQRRSLLGHRFIVAPAAGDFDGTTCT